MARYSLSNFLLASEHANRQQTVFLYLAIGPLNVPKVPARKYGVNVRHLLVSSRSGIQIEGPKRGRPPPFGGCLSRISTYVALRVQSSRSTDGHLHSVIITVLPELA